MRRFFERIISRIFGSRYGIALLLAVIVLAVVGGANLFARSTGVDDEGSSNGSGLSGGVASPQVTVNPTEGNDGVSSPEPTASPVVSPGTAEPVTVARAFAALWVKHKGVSAEKWHAALLPHSTVALATKLEGVDPAGVPADRVTGEPVMVPHAENFVEVTIPVDSGRLILRLVAPDGRWLVDGIDWDRS